MPTFLFLFLVSAIADYKQLLVIFLNQEVTQCIGFIINKDTIASAEGCGTTYINFKMDNNGIKSPLLIPYCHGKEVKIIGDPVIVKRQNLAFFKVGLLISFYLITTIISNKYACIYIQFPIQRNLETYFKKSRFTVQKSPDIAQIDDDTHDLIRATTGPTSSDYSVIRSRAAVSGPG